jgi:hypothetical protein
MDATHPQPSDPVELLRLLDADAIRDRIDALDRERDALRVLLRAAQRTRRDGHRTAGARQEVARA